MIHKRKQGVEGLEELKTGICMAVNIGATESNKNAREWASC